MTCAFASCAEAAGCAMVGGCVGTRFTPSPANASDIKKGAHALVGTKPRPSGDPARIKRNRKALT